MNQKKINGLDGLRAFAILGITIFHMFPDFLPGGYLGVILFFVITGFLLTINNSKKIYHDEFSLKTYYLSRIKRIYPALLIVLLITMAVFFFWMPNQLAGSRWETLSILLGYNNWWQIIQNLDYFTRALNASPFSHFWFLGIELQFYLFFPLLLWGLYQIRKKKGPKTMIQVLSILTLGFTLLMPIYYLLGFDITRIYYGTDSRLFSLLAGMLLGYLYRPRLVAKYPTAFSLGFLGIFMIFHFTLGGESPALYLGLMAVVTLLAMAWIQIVGPKETFLDHPIFQWISKHSYTLYLWQYPIIFFFQYNNWSNVAWILLEIILLVALTVWTDWFLSLFNKEKRSLIPPKFQKAVLIQGVIALAIQGIGVYACITSPESDTKELQERIAKNQEAISQTNDDQSDTGNQDPEKPDYDYSKTGNSQTVSKKGLIFIGDSVMLAAADAIQTAYPDATINAEVSRHIGQEQEPLKELKEQGKMKNTVVVSLGTNGVIYPELAEQLLDIIGDTRSVFWINNHCPGLSWQDSNNTYLNELAQKHSNVTIIDWHSAASQHPEWLGQDGIHPNTDGAQAFADLITSALDDVIQKQKAVQEEA